MTKKGKKYTGILPAKSDLVFKAIFTNPNNKDLVLAFLRDVLSLKIESVLSIGYGNTELNPNKNGGKLSRLDVRVVLDNRDTVNIEIQLVDQKNVRDRAFYYSSKLVAEVSEEGKDYRELRRTISLIILDFNIFEKEGYFSKYKYMDVDTHEVLTDKAEINFIELKKHAAELKEPIDIWMAFLNAKKEEELNMIGHKNKVMEKAVNELKRISSDEALRFEYEMREKAERDYRHGMSVSYKDGKAEGEQIGMQKGIEIGKGKGIEIGRAEGIEEGQQIGMVKGIEIGREKTIIELIGKIIGRKSDDEIIEMFELSQREFSEIKKRIIN